GHSDRRPSVPLAFISRFHEGKDFNRLLRVDRRRAGLEKFHDLAHKRRVAIERARACLPFFSPHQPMEILVLPENPFAFSAPNSNNFDLSVRTIAALDGLTATAENSVKRLDTIHAVPEDVRMMRLQ